MRPPKVIFFVAVLLILKVSGRLVFFLSSSLGHKSKLLKQTRLIDISVWAAPNFVPYSMALQLEGGRRAAAFFFHQKHLPDLFVEFCSNPDPQKLKTKF